MSIEDFYKWAIKNDVEDHQIIVNDDLVTEEKLKTGFDDILVPAVFLI